MCSKIEKFAAVFLFVIFIFHGGCKSPFTPSEALPVIWVNTFSLSFACAEVGTNPPSQVLQIKNTGANTLHYTIEDDADFYDVDWLTVTPSSGSSSGQIVEHTVTIDKAGMNARDEEYAAKITISSSEAYNSPQVVDVKLKIEKEPPPEIKVTPMVLTFSAKEGAVSNPTSQSIRVKNTGQQVLNYTISDDADWLDVTPKSGTSTGNEITHSVSVDIRGLNEGTYKAKITITDDNAVNNPQTVEVTLTISKKPPPIISVSPTSLAFSGEEGGTNPSPQYIKIKNSGEGTLNYTISDDAAWMNVSPSSGTSTGQEVTHSVSVDIGGLGEGTYSGTLSITDANAGNSPQIVAVTLTISKQAPPEISVNPTSLTFSAKEGANPSSQIIKIRNSGGGTLTYSVSDNAAWLTASPTSGSSSGEENSHSVSVDTSGLTEGSYSAAITITDANASNSPQTVNVSLNITKEQPPEIWVSATSLTFSATEGGSNPSSQTIRIKNSGEQTLNYTISDDANWLSVNPSSGSSTGAENTHTVSVNISGLSAGTHNAIITVSDTNASNNPQTVSVTLNLNAPPSDNEISVSCSPTSGGTGSTVTVTIAIKGNTSDISAFGLELTYNSSMFTFQGHSTSGALTESWGSGVDANEISPGTVRIGGWGGANSIPKGSIGTLIIIYLNVTCSGCSSGTQGQICIGSFTDDIVGMTPAPQCATFTVN